MGDQINGKLVGGSTNLPMYTAVCREIHFFEDPWNGRLARMDQGETEKNQEETGKYQTICQGQSVVGSVVGDSGQRQFLLCENDLYLPLKDPTGEVLLRREESYFVQCGDVFVPIKFPLF